MNTPRSLANVRSRSAPASVHLTGAPAVPSGGGGVVSARRRGEWHVAGFRGQLPRACAAIPEEAPQRRPISGYTDGSALYAPLPRYPVSSATGAAVSTVVSSQPAALSPAALPTVCVVSTRPVSAVSCGEAVRAVCPVSFHARRYVTFPPASAPSGSAGVTVWVARTRPSPENPDTPGDTCRHLSAVIGAVADHWPPAVLY